MSEYFRTRLTELLREWDALEKEEESSNRSISMRVLYARVRELIKVAQYILPKEEAAKILDEVWK